MVLQGYLGLYTVYRNIWGYIGFIWGYMGLYRVYIGLYGVIRGYIGLHGLYRVYIGLYGVVYRVYIEWKQNDVRRLAWLLPKKPKEDLKCRSLKLERTAICTLNAKRFAHQSLTLSPKP